MGRYIFGAAASAPAAVIGAAGAALAQNASPPAPPVLPDPLTPEAVRDLVATLSDQEVRQLLLDRLDAVAEAETAAAQSVEVAQDPLAMAGEAMGSYLYSAVTDLGAVFGGIVDTFAAFGPAGGIWGVLIFLGLTVLAIVAGYAARFAFEKAAAGWIEPRASHAVTFGGQVMAVLRRLAGSLAGIAVYAVVAGLIIRFIFPLVAHHPKIGEGAWLIAAAAGVNVPIMLAILRLALAPERPELRLLAAGDGAAKGLYKSFRRILILLATLTVLGKIQLLAGVNIYATGWNFWASLVFCIAAIVFVWRQRHHISDIMSADGAAVTPGSWPHVWPRIAIALIALQWLLNALIAALGRGDLLRGQGQLTIILILLLPGIDALIRAVSQRLTPSVLGDGEAATKAGMASGRALLRAGRVFVYAAFVLLIADLWGVNLFGLASSGVGARFAAGLVQFLTICAIGYLIFELVNIWFMLRLSRETTALPGEPGAVDELAGGEGGPAGSTSSRLATVLPLLRWVALSAIVVFTLMVALSQAGVDIAPLLAGAGVFGLAVGFGAQTLVKDIVSGLFFLVDDAFRQGEYIDASGTMGTVERISVRSVQLRHHKGAVHTVPYGEISKVTNFSRDWVIVKLKFTVPFGTDPNKVKKIFKQIGKDIDELPDFKGDYMQPFKSQGVLEFDDVGIVLRGKFMARPGKQFMIRKEIFNRVVQAFDEAGIEFARREVHVRVNDDDAEPADAQRKAAAAAGGAQADPQAG